MYLVSRLNACACVPLYLIRYLQANIFSYAAPTVTMLSQKSGSADGGDWISATITNFGPMWMGPAPMAASVILHCIALG